MAYLLSESGFSVEVYELLPKFSVKPCGMGVPIQIESFFRLPESFILSKIKGYRAYLDGEMLVEGGGNIWGYTIDKEGLISYLLEKVKVVRKRVDDSYPMGLAKEFQGKKVIISTGFYSKLADRERINAVEVTIEKNKADFEEDIIEIRFDTGLMGYFWIFPWGDKGINVGVGGLESFDVLKKMLVNFLHDDPRFKRSVDVEVVQRIKGAQIVSSGINLRKLVLGENIYAVGELVGSVFPLTGEGIRPSMLTSKILFDSMQANKNYVVSVESSDLYYAIALQSKVYRLMKGVPKTVRKMIMKSIPKNWLIKFGLGEFTKEEIKQLKGFKGLFFELLNYSGL
ncbi:MAG: NAD(P)/FAD-dependent oxidoreductase [Thermoprotei archaeon]|nr:NAD(P)/FAD-dependent oxidoreductase [Thermoprotei archaeon]